MKEDYETEERKQAAADVLFNYSKFVAACIGNRVRPCDLRMHLMKIHKQAITPSIQANVLEIPSDVNEISGIPTTLKRESFPVTASPDAMGESSSSGTARLDKTDSFRAL